MSMHKFYATCDKACCGFRTEEYENLPFCTECNDQVCARHAMWSDDETGKAICLECGDENAR